MFRMTIIVNTRDLSLNLPAKLNNDFFAKLNNHLIETNNRGNKPHTLECEFCISEKKSTIDFIHGQIHSVDILEKKIMELIYKK